MSTLQAPASQQSRLRTGSLLMALAGLGFIGYGVIFFIMNFTDSFLELGIGPDQVDKGKDAIEAFSPSLFHYVSHLQIALSGFIAAAGVGVAALSWYGVRRGEMWAFVTAVVVPVLALGVALPAHSPWGLAPLGHLGLIYLAVAVFVVGAVIAFTAFRSPRT